MPTRAVGPPRTERRLPPPWVAVVLAVAVHVVMGAMLFWDDLQPRVFDDPTTRMGAGPVLPAEAVPATRAEAPQSRREITARLPPPEPVVAAPQPAVQPPAASPVAPVEPARERQREAAPPPSRDGARPTAPRATVGGDARPSFDCRLARSAAEVLICSDQDLARQDRELARLYDRARTVTGNSPDFRQETQEEWRRRERSCSTRACLREWYAHRRQQLNQTIARGRP